MEFQENEYRGMFAFKSFCGNDFAEEKPIHPQLWAGISWKQTYQTICACSWVKWDCVFGKGNRESSNPPTKKQKTVVHKPLKLTARFGNEVTTKSESAFEIKQVYVSMTFLLDLHNFSNRNVKIHVS